MGGQIAQPGGSAANLDVERRRVLPEILKPALRKIVGISEQVTERNSSFVHGMSLAPQRWSGNPSPVNTGGRTSPLEFMSYDYRPWPRDFSTMTPFGVCAGRVTFWLLIISQP